MLLHGTEGIRQGGGERVDAAGDRNALPPEFDKKAQMELRYKVWDALREDDAAALMEILRLTAAQLRVTEEVLVYNSQWWLWRNNGRQKPSWWENRGLASVCAGNIKGVPDEGAIRCLECLFERFDRGSVAWSGGQLAVARNCAANALDKGCARFTALSLVDKKIGMLMVRVLADATSRKPNVENDGDHDR